MRILIVTQYFWPENFRINDIAKYLTSKNNVVDILTGEPNYPDGYLPNNYIKQPENFSIYFSANIIRVPIFLRGSGSKSRIFLNYLSFIISAIIFGSFKLRKKKYDLVISFATSPLTSSLPAIYFSWIKNCKSIIWVFDLWPDILLELNILKNNFIYFVIKKISLYIYNNFDIILVQSISFKKKIINYLEKKNINKIHYLPAWSEEIEYSDNLKISSDDNVFRIVFTGNVGDAQNFDNLLKAAILLKKQNDIQWIVVGSGRKLDHVNEQLKKNNINNFLIEGQKDISEISKYHQLADVLLISLRGGESISSTIPGKLQTYLNSNKFILGFIKGEAKKIIEDAKVGICVDPDNYIELANQILFLKKNKHLLKLISDNNLGKKYLHLHFNKKIILENFNNYLDEVYNLFDQIKLIKHSTFIPFRKNFMLSGLNLAFLGYYIEGSIKFNKDLYIWPDGIFKKRFFNKSVKKISGAKLIHQLSIPDFIKNIYVLGPLSMKSMTFLKNKFDNKKIIHIDLPYGDISAIYEASPKYFLEEDLIICTLPTPKQEILSSLISKKSKFFKILCIGGALRIASGEIKNVPILLDKMGLEWIWRLRTDTMRRVNRLIISFYYYVIGEISLKFGSIKTKIIN